MAHLIVINPIQKVCVVVKLKESGFESSLIHFFGSLMLHTTATWMNASGLTDSRATPFSLSWHTLSLSRTHTHFFSLSLTHSHALTRTFSLSRFPNSSLSLQAATILLLSNEKTKGKGLICSLSLSLPLLHTRNLSLSLCRFFSPFSQSVARRSS